MSELLTQRRQIAAKAEVTPGTAVSLAAADVLIEPFELSVTEEVFKYERNPHGTSISANADLIGQRARRFAFTAELKGSGVAATAPKWGLFMEACKHTKKAVSSLTVGAITSGPFQHGETITGGTSGATAKVLLNTANGTTTLYIVDIVGTFSAGSETITGSVSTATATESGGATASQGNAYYPTSVPGTAVSMASMEDGYIKSGRGVRGNCVMTGQLGTPFRGAFDFMGAEDLSQDQALFSGVDFDNTEPFPFMQTNLILGAFNPIFANLEINLNNQVAMREDAGVTAEGYISALVTDRRITATIDCEAELAATKNFYLEWHNRTLQYFQLTIGNVAGNIVTLVGPKVQITNVRDGDRNGIALMQLDLLFTFYNESTKDDEYCIFVR